MRELKEVHKVEKGGEEQQPALIYYLLKVMTAKHNPFFSMCFWFFSPQLFSLYLFSPSQRMTWLVQPGTAQLRNFIHVYFTGIFLSIFSPEHFPSQNSAFPLQRYAVFNLPLVRCFLAWESEHNNHVRLFYLANHSLCFNTYRRIHFWKSIRA